MERNVVKELFKKRLQQNQEIITDKEYYDIINNIDSYIKVYLLGAIDVKN